MMQSHIIGIGWVTAAGIGQGRRGDVFAMPQGPLPAVSRKDLFADPYPRFGRLDDFSQLGLAGIALALADAGLDHWEEKRNVGLFAGTVGGCLATDMDYYDSVLPQGGALASPNLFAYTLSNTFLGEAAIRFGLVGPSFVANLNDGNRLGCLQLALESLHWGECDIALAGFCELSLDKHLAQNGHHGTVFLVLSKESADSSQSYGVFGLDEKGTFFLDQHIVSDWSQLVAAFKRNS
ncbi:beta-ketoacyl synthase N-terminal-like domain-containing protein [Geoalkalibacter halelectricus]|uniref:Beta-ketoacyl synthase-like N-terminal domain-containing protein n=1 Tax=Geoalkalibacter halelectricus TaxID=2847045 RepID=A0ABY5ZKZ9_9BACT|nr:beta-ketoacyl synthase N-terminal-like domain-containing protein [Geoalkalibacter halelectricus]MDO3379819.1 hypothetical protein [Geoalkalibacter halelectricus]UWZ79253.1 hypothetical protein L9S41_16455 [Geoalkalibacter halelectricus]